MTSAYVKGLCINSLGYILSRAPVLWTMQHVCRPHVHLHDLDGSLYMGRWSVVDEYVRVNGKDTNRRTLLSRVLERLTGYTAIRLHHIARPDHDRDLHNHPFSYRTFILKGNYAEEYEVPGEGFMRGGTFLLKGAYRWVHRGQSVTGGEGHYHRIDQMPAEGVWTLFCMTPNTNAWGFKVDGEHVPSRRYFRMKGYGRQHRSTGPAPSQ